MLSCHCRQCRRTRGRHGAYTRLGEHGLELVERRGLRRRRPSDAARRDFSSGCGAGLFSRPGGAPWVSVSAGTLDTPTGLDPIGRIFIADAADDYRIADGLPKHDGSAPDAGP